MPYATSEQRHAIDLMGVTNCTIDGLKILDTGGDGVLWELATATCTAKA